MCFGTDMDLRNGKHLGLSEIWPLIAMKTEEKPIILLRMQPLNGPINTFLNRGICSTDIEK